MRKSRKLGIDGVDTERGGRRRLPISNLSATPSGTERNCSAADSETLGGAIDARMKLVGV